MSACYSEVALPVPLRHTFTYAIPAPLASSVAPGSRVLVPFRNRAMVGVALELTDRPPETKKLKEIREVLDPVAALTAQLLELGQWIAGYYLAPLGEVFRAMLPPAVGLRQEHVLVCTEAGSSRLRELSALPDPSEDELAEMALLQLCEAGEKPLRTERLRKLAGGAGAAQRLLRRGCLEARETARHTKARTQTIVAWNAAFAGPPASPAENRIHELLTATYRLLPLKLLLKRTPVTASVAKRLVKQGRLLAWEEPLAEEEGFFESDFAPPVNVLNAEQKCALSAIQSWLDAREFTVGLLHGVTGSGKTEVYLRAVEAALERGRTALVLVPEIPLTHWMGRLCRAWLGDKVAVLHSSLPERERAREWWRVRQGEARVVVGTRSAVFAPLENLGLVIVDEEQEASYKQEETPRYHGRDVAIVRAKLSGAAALLGSATPSLESFHHARTGKYRLLQLETRVENRPLASVEVVDMREEFRRTHRAGSLSDRLSGALSACLEAKQQAVMLINRRGYSWFMLCRSCGAAVQCENCSISLTYHKRRERLECHYCDFWRRVPKTCPKCQSEHLYFFGEGAEQIEEHLRERFPGARMGRLDRDVARTRRAYQQVLGAFASGQLDLLVGTQMVAKGHDFERVTLVGVVAADLSLSLPDFRAAERTFQLLTQVAGRAGRGPLPGQVLVQTYYPEHYAIHFAAQQDYGAFFEKELQFRRLMHYPPFTALASIVVHDRKIENAVRWARSLGAFLGPQEGRELKVLGPAAAPLARLKGEYRFQFLLKSARRKQLTGTLGACLGFCAEKKIPETAVLIDVDPVSLM